MLSQRRHCGDPLEWFAEPGQSSITEAMEDSEYDADDLSSMISSLMKTRMMTLIGRLPVGTNTFKITSHRTIAQIPCSLYLDGIQNINGLH